MQFLGKKWLQIFFKMIRVAEKSKVIGVTAVNGAGIPVLAGKNYCHLRKLYRTCLAACAGKLRSTSSMQNPSLPSLIFLILSLC